MGNSISHKQLHASATGKVILSDGSVHQFNKPLTVAELMLEHPQQVVIEFGAAVSGKRPTPLPADMKLDKKKIYLMLPMKRGKPVSLSSQEIHGVVLSANLVLRSRSLLSSSRFLPFFARICPAGHPGQACALPNKESCAERTSNSKYMPQFDLPEDLDARPEYLSRQFSGKGTWKPNLDTIKEKKVDKKKSHWLF
ncbi:PREDICTED: uncharacterized protein LOC103334045 [Prunus mume]|uniref:Uncharacterized protein LOC103334045 n=1 Tax=Prunus mume TaxID=102107 RepID=A0ABM0P6U6_PRUMU|nr:PREDICTED: uncharacterized protein LOC103334045 [Prunus mume]